MNQQKLIDQIHSEFDTAQDRLLQQANEVLYNASQSKQSQIESIGERLSKVGFINTPLVKVSNEIKGAKRISNEQARLIQHYKQNYPFLKFLTESELDRICTKYNLVYAGIDRYIKDVPEKNLRDIENAQPLKTGDLLDDFLVFKCSCVSSGLTPIENKQLIEEGITILKSEFREMCNNETLTKYFGKPINCEYQTLEWSASEVIKSGLFIAAPESHFNTKGLTKKGLGFFEIFKTEVKDPIVFRYVNGGIQVITKWGLEANDPELVIPTLN